MPDSFDSTETNPGLLKNTYGDTGLQKALNKKREKLANTRLGLITDEEEKDETTRD